jgi:hypothetical protein
MYPRHLAENEMSVMAYALAGTDAPVPRVGSTPQRQVLSPNRGPSAAK